MAGQALTARTVTAKTRAASGQYHGHPGRPAPGVLLVAPGEVGHPLGQRGLAQRLRVRRGGDAPRHAADGGHYWMLRICFTDCASTLEGSGWKLTWDRYDGAVAVLRVDRPLQHRADVLGRRAARLVGRHDGVLVVDDRVAAADVAVDQRDRPIGRGLLDEAGRLGGDRRLRRHLVLALGVLQRGVARPACRAWVR